MTRQLRRALLFLVLLNLLFVQITNAVGPRWMIPLVALTLFAPYLVRLQSSLIYRSAWNIALLAIFGLLIADVRATGIRYMLEDGLILAAFCQVHVLNNLSRQQRPDLVFFNSFLIALVTGFFCQDVIYSLVFVVYALVLIVGLTISSASTVGNLPSRTLPPHELRGAMGRGVRLGVVTMFCTGLAFTFWPRDFDREGLVDEDLMDSASAESEVAFSDQIRLDRNTNAKLSNRIVMRAEIRRGDPADVPAYWRGATFTRLTRYGWTADTNQQGLVNRARQIDEPWRPTANRGFVRLGHRTGVVMDIELDDRRAQHLFMPADVNRIQFECLAWPNIDGTFRLSRNDAGRISYVLELNEPGDRLRKMPGPPDEEHVFLHPRRIPRGLHDWNVEVRRRISPTGSRRQTVESIRAYVARARDYVLPGRPGAAENLDGFLAGRGGGHCEYFATSMVVLLRLNKVPCRMVSGYLASEWNDDATQLVIRSNHAHAWVEVWDEERGWYVVDPTPAQSVMTEQGDSLFAKIGSLFERAWAAVTSFDGKTRDAALAWAKERALGVVAFGRHHPAWTVVLLGLLFVLRRLWQGRHARRLNPDVRDYLGVLAKLKLELLPGETPRQLLNRADLPPERRELLATATERHEAARYG